MHYSYGDDGKKTRNPVALTLPSNTSVFVLVELHFNYISTTNLLVIYLYCDLGPYVNQHKSY